MSGAAIANLDNFIGQPENIQALKYEIDGAKLLGLAIRHLLLVGNAGLGKTTLARSIAGQMEVKFYELICTPQFTVQQLSQIITQMQAFEILFIDEIHIANYAVQEALQRVMTENAISGFEKDAMTGKWKKTDDIKLPPLTIVAATDRPGTLLKALLSRFGPPISMRSYSHVEIKNIVRARACQLNRLLADDAAAMIAVSCAGIPREAMQRLDIIHKYAAVKQISEITTTTVQSCLNANDLSESGLDYNERQYLKCVNAAGAWGERLITLQSQLTLDGGYIQKNIEPKLIRLGLIKIDQRRHITLKGRDYIERNLKCR